MSVKYQLLLFFYVTIFTAYYLITPTPNPYHVTLKSFIFKRANFRGMSILHWISLAFMDFIGFHGLHGFACTSSFYIKTTCFIIHWVYSLARKTHEIHNNWAPTILMIPQHEPAVHKMCTCTYAVLYNPQP